MFACWNAFEVGKQIVGRVSIPMVDVTPTRDGTERPNPNISVKLFAAAREVRLTRPHAVVTAIEILRERVKDDWISVPFVRDSADLHPLTVMNI